jgi:hypothetical protein
LDVVSDFVRSQMVKSYRKSFTDEDGEVSVRVFTSFVDKCIGILATKKEEAERKKAEALSVDAITQSLQDANMK